MKSSIIKQKGIGLIEIMVALVIVAVGILGIAKLQTKVVRSASDANARAVAAIIAQNKVDELRSFVHLTQDTVDPLDTDINKYSFTQISDADVLIAQTQAGIVNAADMGFPENTQFTLDWFLVGNYYYGATDLIPAVAEDKPDPTDPSPDFKVVDVVVTWTDIDGSPQQHTLRTVIDGYSPQFTARYGNATIGSHPPIIPYTPELAPDVVPVTIDVGGTGDIKKESSKPHPDVSKKGASTTVRFETVTYAVNASLSTGFETLKREEFLTAVCTCTNAGTSTVTKRTVGKTVWDDELKQLKDITDVEDSGVSIQKAAVDNSSGELQAAECTICCRDGDDVSGSDLKACRLKRIDGVMRLFKPWRMITLNVIPSSYFNPADADTTTSIAGMNDTIQQANVDRYSDYVTAKVRDALEVWETAGTEAAITVDTNFKADTDLGGAGEFVNGSLDHTAFVEGSTNHREMQVRAVFLDYPPIGIYGGGDYTAKGDGSSDPVPLERVPFFENNFTQVAGWIPDVNEGSGGSGAGDQSFDGDYTDNHDDMDLKGPPCLNTDAVDTGRNYITNEEFFHFGGGTTTDCPTASRGDFYPIIATASGAVETISSMMFTSNEGIVDKNVDAVTLSRVLDSDSVTLSASAATATIDLTVTPP